MKNPFNKLFFRMSHNSASASEMSIDSATGTNLQDGHKAVNCEARFTPSVIISLKSNEVFVFGSNLAGQHGGGAARLAMERFGAIWGQGVGLQGQSYAIPTMQGGVETIRPYVAEFIDFARKHRDLTFLVTRIGCGIAGFHDSDIAPLFAGAIDEPNIVLPRSFVEC